jgi:hypothetical protein
MQTSLAAEAAKRGVLLEDALALFPPTRRYSDAEVKRDLIDRGVNGILLVKVGDSGVQTQYAGTIFTSNYSGFANATMVGNNTLGAYSGQGYGMAVPVYNSRRQTVFSAQLLDPVSGRNLWVGNGQVNAGGRLFVGDNVSAANFAAAIFNDLQSKGIVGPSS